MPIKKIDLDPIEATLLTIIGSRRKTIEQITFELNQARKAIELKPISIEKVKIKLQGLLTKGLIVEMKIQNAVYWDTTKLAEGYT